MASVDRENQSTRQKQAAAAEVFNPEQAKADLSQLISQAQDKFDSGDVIAASVLLMQAKDNFQNVRSQYPDFRVPKELFDRFNELEKQTEVAAARELLRLMTNFSTKFSENTQGKSKEELESYIASMGSSPQEILTHIVEWGNWLFGDDDTHMAFIKGVMQQRTSAANDNTEASDDDLNAVISKIWEDSLTQAARIAGLIDHDQWPEGFAELLQQYGVKEVIYEEEKTENTFDKFVSKLQEILFEVEISQINTRQDAQAEIRVASSNINFDSLTNEQRTQIIELTSKIISRFPATNVEVVSQPNSLTRQLIIVRNAINGGNLSIAWQSLEPLLAQQFDDALPKTERDQIPVLAVQIFTTQLEQLKKQAVDEGVTDSVRQSAEELEARVRSNQGLFASAEEAQAMLGEIGKLIVSEKSLLDTQEFILWREVSDKLPKTRQEYRSRGHDFNSLNNLKTDFINAFSKLEKLGKIPETIYTQHRNTLELVDHLLSPQDPREMTIEEVVDELSSLGSYDSQDRILALQSRYEDLLPTVTDRIRKSWLIDRYSIARSAIAGTSKKRDWATNLNKVWGPLVSQNATIESLWLGLFFGVTKENAIKKITFEKFKSGEVPADTRAADMWDYIIKRIKHKKIHGGLSEAVSIIKGTYVDATGGLIPQLSGESVSFYQDRLKKIYDLDEPFGYNNLFESVGDQFEKQIELIFIDIPTDIRKSLLNFFKTFGAKSAGYMPWLMRGATRSHGFPPGETERDDESAYLNPWALRLYKATRYDDVKWARYMQRAQYLSKHDFLQIIGEHSPGKIRSAEELYEMMNGFNQARWGGDVPVWIYETRVFFGLNKEVDINSTICPAFPEIFTNIIRLEHEIQNFKNDFESGALDQAAFDRVVSQFVEKYRFQGYFNYSKLREAERAGDSVAKLDAFLGRGLLMAGTDLSTNFSVDQYSDLVTKKFEEMIDTFDKPVKPHLSKEEVINRVIDEWSSGLVGKAKLYPGPHQRFFAPLTCELITVMLNNYKEGNNRFKVNALYADLLGRLSKAKGLPPFVMDEVVRMMGGREDVAPDYCVRRFHDFYGQSYLKELALHQLEHDNSFGANIERAKIKSIPLYSGIKMQSPFEEVGTVEKDTTANGDKK